MATSHLALALVVSSSLGASALVNGPSLLRVRGGGLPHLVPAAPALLRVRGGGPSLSEWWSQDAQAVPNPALLDDALSGGRDGSDTSAAPPDAIQVFARVARFLWQPDAKLRLFVVASVAALMLSKSLNVLVPFALKNAIDSLGASSTASLARGTTPLLLAYAGARLGVSLANELRTVAFTRVSQTAQRAFSGTLFRRLHELDASFHASNPTGLLAVAFSRGVGGFRSLLFQLLFSVLPVALELGLSTVVLARKFSPLLAGVTLLTFALYAAWTAVMVEVRIRLRKRLARLDNAKAAYLVDSLGGTEAIKLVGTEDAESARFDCFLRSIASTTVRSTELMAVLNAGQAIIFGGGLLASLMIAASGYRAGRLSVGDVVAVNGLLLQLARPMDFIGYTFSEIRQSLVDMDAMLKMLNTPTIEATTSTMRPPTRTSETAAASAAAVEAGEGVEATAPALPIDPPSVVFRGVSYTYPNASTPALADATFEAPAGGTTALVGLSGSGKSTCLRLVSRLCDADAGEVLLWGRSVRDMPRAALRSRIGFIAQSPAIFDDTLYWNIELGALGKDRAAIEAAVEAAALGPSVMQLPSGYETRVGERGSRLSGGERQRVAVARALLREDAPLLLADEPTASADALTESTLVDSLRRGTTNQGHNAEDHGRTLLVVVHRLASVCPSADNVVVFRDGRVVEQGTHTELLGRRGDYARLWRAQATEAWEESVQLGE